jgi:hypothetical protein
MSMVFALELFLWAALFSLLLRRPLTAAIAGVAAAAAVEIMAGYIHPQYTPASYAAALPLRAAIASMLALADVGLGLRWLGERQARQTPRIASQVSSPQRPSYVRTSTNTRVVARLVWQQWRQSRWLLLAIGALVVPLAVRFLLLATRIRAGNSEDVFGGLVTIDLALAAFPLLGTVTFMVDQQGRSFQFLADHGVRPRHIWLSRQLPGWLAATLLSILLSAVVAAFVVLLAPDLMPNEPNEVAYVELLKCLVAGIGCAALLGFTAGQLCSMLFRNGLLAAFFSLLLTSVLALWCGLMWLWGVNWLWSVLPLPLALLLATWLRTPHWLVDRNTLRAWLPVGLALVVPAIVLLTVVPCYRAYEIPVVDPGFSPAQYAHPITAADQATRDLYEQASMQYVPRGTFYPQSAVFVGMPEIGKGPLAHEEIAWVDANQKAINMTLEASRRKNSYFFDPLGQERYGSTGATMQLALLLVVSAVRLEEQDDLDAALERYLAVIRMSVQLRHYPRVHWFADEVEQATYERLPYWAVRPKQTPARIIAAVHELDELTANLPADGDAVIDDYFRLHRALSGSYAAMLEAYGRGLDESWQPLTWLWWQFPSERTRAFRLLNVLTRRELDELANAEKAARRGEAIRRPPLKSFASEVELPYALHEAVHVPPIEVPRHYEQDDRIRTYMAMVAFHRGVRLSLLLEAWKIRHGTLPRTLDELVGPDLDRVPIDPFTGAPFRYVRDGLGISLRWHQQVTYVGYLYHFGQIEANVPFVWSAGARVVYTAPGEGEKEGRYKIIEDPDRPQGVYPRSEYDLWERGWPFPVP